jgi:hypothetical protein
VIIMSEHVDHELLRVVAHAVLQSTERLIGEGLQPQVLETLLGHARALLSGRDPAADPSGPPVHAVGLRESLQGLHGPTSSTLLAWLGDALDPRP